MERLDKLSSGFKGKNMGKDNPTVASPAAADHTAFLLDMLQTSFDVPWQTLVYLGPAIRQEQDPSLSELHSWDLPPGVPLCAVPPTSALRQCIQTPHHLDAELVFAADF